MIKYLVFIFLYVLGVSVYAQNAVLDEELNTDASKFRGTFTLVHADGFNEDVDSATTIAGTGIYNLTKNWALNIRQRITKVYEYDKFGGREYTWDDLRVVARYRFQQPPSFFNAVSTDFFFYVPNSEASRDAGRRGRVLGRFVFIKSLFKNRVTLGYQPYGMYFFNRFKQTEEGALNRSAIVGNNAFVSVSPFERISFMGLVGFGQTYDEIGDFQQDGRASNEGFLDIDVSMTYMPTNKIIFTGGYSHSDTQVKGGTFEFYAFDPESSRYYIAASYVF